MNYKLNYYSKKLKQFCSYTVIANSDAEATTLGEAWIKQFNVSHKRDYKLVEVKLMTEQTRDDVPTIEELKRYESKAENKR